MKTHVEYNACVQEMKAVVHQAEHNRQFKFPSQNRPKAGCLAMRTGKLFVLPTIECLKYLRIHVLCSVFCKPTDDPHAQIALLSQPFATHCMPAPVPQAQREPKACACCLCARSLSVCVPCVGCTHTLQVSDDACYGIMEYDLVQGANIPTVIKDQAWYLKQLKAIMDLQAKHHKLRSFYMFECK